MKGGDTASSWKTGLGQQEGRLSSRGTPGWGLAVVAAESELGLSPSPSTKWLGGQVTEPLHPQPSMELAMPRPRMNEG